MDVNKHKSKKHKDKKSKTEKKKRKHSSDSDSDESDMQWVEAPCTDSTSQHKHEEWMENDFLLSSYSRSDLGRKSKKKQELEEAAIKQKKILEERELNPYYKSKTADSSAVSEVEDPSLKLPPNPIGDGGYSWLKRAYQRAKEQAAEEGRTLEEVAEERWGSLEKLENMLQDAKNSMLDKHSSKSEAPSKYSKNKYERERYERSNHDEKDYHKNEHRSSKHDSKEEERDTHHYYKRDKQDYYSTTHEKYSQRSHSEKQSYQDEKSDEKYHHRLRKFIAPPNDSDDRYRSNSHSKGSSQPVPAWKKPSSREFVQPRENKPEHKIKDPSEEMKKQDHERNISKSSEPEQDSESSSEEEDRKEKAAAAQRVIEELVLNQNEMNYLGARLLRAKLEGDSELASRIQKVFDTAKDKRAEFLQSGGKVEEYEPRDDVIDNLVDFYPLPLRLKSKMKKTNRKRNRDVYVGPLRRKGSDKDGSSLPNIYERERMSTIDDQMKMYFAAASTCQESLNDECDADVSGKIEKKMNAYPSQERDMQKAILDHKKLDHALKKCRFCWDQSGLQKHTVIAKGNNVFLCAPPYRSLVEGHCFIVPIAHVPSTLHLDENEYKEIQDFKRALIKMFSDANQCVAFMETSYRLKFHPHAHIECIPMPKETGELAPLYFKKAIDESEYEWAQNKKLIDLSKKGLRHSVPKGLPFFSVEFGLEGGFAHIIEDEREFPHYFGKEIIGGMLEIDSHNIVKQKEESAQEICKKVLKMVRLWWDKYRNYV